MVSYRGPALWRAASAATGGSMGGNEPRVYTRCRFDGRAFGGTEADPDNSKAPREVG